MVQGEFFVPQRFPTVRRGTQLGNSEHSAKVGAFFDCRFTESSKRAWLLVFSHDGSVEIKCITAGKIVRLQ
jgi:hypothetical protein